MNVCVYAWTIGFLFCLSLHLEIIVLRYSFRLNFLFHSLSVFECEYSKLMLNSIGGKKTTHSLKTEMKWSVENRRKSLKLMRSQFYKIMWNESSFYIVRAAIFVKTTNIHSLCIVLRGRKGAVVCSHVCVRLFCCIFHIKWLVRMNSEYTLRWWPS